MKFKTLLIIIILSFYSFAVNKYISTSGNDNNNGNTFITAYASVQKSMASRSPGDTIFVDTGSYSLVETAANGTPENPIVIKPYSLIKPKIASIWIQHKNWIVDSVQFIDCSARAAIRITKDSVLIKNCDVVNGSYTNAVWVNNTDGVSVTFLKCLFRDCTRFYVQTGNCDVIKSVFTGYPSLAAVGVAFQAAGYSIWV